MYQICVKKRRVKRGSSLTIARLSKVAVYTVVVNITSILKTIVHYFHKSENPSRPLNLKRPLVSNRRPNVSWLPRGVPVPGKSGRQNICRANRR